VIYVKISNENRIKFETVNKS